MKNPSCRTCLFAGMEPVKEWAADGGWRNTCALWGKRRPGGCAGWQRDREDKMNATGPTSNEVRQAKERVNAE